MAIGDVIRDFLAQTIYDHSSQVLLVALGALAVALALSFIARIAFWVMGGVGTVAAIWILATGGFTTPVLTLAGIVLVGGWVGGFLVRGAIKFGSVVVTLFSVGLFWTQQWAKSYVEKTDLFPWYYFAGAAALLIVAVLVMPTIAGKLVKGTVKTIIPGGKKDDKPAEKPAGAPKMEVKR